MAQPPQGLWGAIFSEQVTASHCRWETGAAGPHRGHTQTLLLLLLLLQVVVQLAVVLWPLTPLLLLLFLLPPHSLLPFLLPSPPPKPLRPLP